MKRIDLFDMVYEFGHNEPLPPPGVLVRLGGSILKVVSNQHEIGGGFSIRARYHDAPEFHQAMETTEIKKVLSEQGFTKAEIEIILGCVRGVRIAPLAYGSVNDMTEEIIEAREYKDKVRGALAAVGAEPVKEKVKRATRSDKGVPKKPVPAQVTHEPEVKPEPAPVAMAVVKKPAAGKKVAVPTPKKKETAEQIAANIKTLGDGPSEDTDDIPL